MSFHRQFRVAAQKRAAKPVKRLTALAHELAADGLLSDAGKKSHAELHKVLDAAQARYASEISTARSSVLTFEGKTLIADLHSKEATFDDFVDAADHVVIEDAYRRAGRALSPDVARTYAEHLAAKDEDADDREDALLDAHATLAALGLVPEVKEYLDAESDKLAKKWLTESRVAIKALSDERQEVYRQLREMSTEPQDLDIAKPTSWLVPTTARHGDTETALPRYPSHLLASDDGLFPADPNAWEAEVLEKELGRPGFAGWYRNPGRSSQDSLAVAYEHGGRVRTVRPDFVFFSEAEDGTISPSSTRTVITLATHSRSSGDSPTMPNGTANISSASTPSPRSTTHSGSSTSPRLPFEPPSPAPPTPLLSTPAKSPPTTDRVGVHCRRLRCSYAASEADRRFERVAVRRYDWNRSYSAAGYRKLMLTYSGTQTMDEPDRRGLLDDIEAFIRIDFGGAVTRPLVVTLTTAIVT